MAKAQPGVLADASFNAIYLSLNERSGQDTARQQLRNFAASVPERQAAMLQNGVEPVYLTFAVGSSYWSELYPGQKPAELDAFPARESGVRVAPSTPTDIFIQIRSNSAGLTFDVARDTLAELGDAVAVAEEVRGFRYHDSRDLTGFVDGTENPELEARAQVTLVGDQDPQFSGGSYLHVQRYEHNLERWNKLSVPEQETAIGRSKADNVEFASADKSTHAHTKRSSLKDDQGRSIEIYRQSLPYGDTQVQGLMFLSFASSSKNFKLILDSMINGDELGNADDLLLYTRAVTGCAYFVPSLDWLAR